MNDRVTWRHIDDDGLSGAAGLAGDEYLAAACDTASSRPVLRLYTYRPTCALVGRFQNAEAEVDVELCRELGVEVGRRPTGGGAIVMGDGQLGVAAVLHPGHPALPPTRRGVFAAHAAAIVAGLRRLGVHATAGSRNDIEVGRRKLAGMGVYNHPGGGVLFHASLVVDIDLVLMLRLLKVPLAKLAGKGIAAVEERMTTVRRELGRPVTVGEVREAIAAGYVEAFGVGLERRPFSAAEQASIDGLVAARYGRPDWVFAHTPTPDMNGEALRRTSAGIVRAYVAMAGTALKSVAITGDFFGSDEPLAAIEARLKWTQATGPAISAAVREVDIADLGVTPDELAGVIHDAVRDALGRQRAGDGYACFADLHRPPATNE